MKNLPACCVALSLLTVCLPELPAEEDGLPIGQFVTIRGTLDPVTAGRIQNQALELHQEAVAGEKKRKAILVLEIRDGASTFGQVRDLAKFLRDQRISNVTTVAWVPERVTGNNVVLALACNEIIMDPEAELGDVGRGKTVDPDDQQFVVSLVKKKHNRKLSPALARSMMDPQLAVIRAKVTRQVDEAKRTESVVVTPPELVQLRQEDVEISDTRRIKEVGELGVYTGTKARDNQILIVQTAANRGEVADIYNLPRESMHEETAEEEVEKVFLIEIKEPITPVVEAFIQRQVDQAVGREANLIIFEIDADRGMLMTSTQLANRIAELEDKKIRTIAYIPRTAEGGAAIVALGCDEIYMHPNATLGKIIPRRIQDEKGKDLSEDDQDKLDTSLTKLAELKNRPAGVLLAMSRADLPVFQATNQKTGRISFMSESELANNGEWQQGPALPESMQEKPFNLDGKRAHELQVSQPPVEDIDELKQRLGVPETVKLKAIERTWVDSVVFWLNSNTGSFLLITIGITCLWLELHMMSGILGIISATCFTLFFWSHMLGGTAGWLEVVLFLLGTALVVLEIFFIPGFGVFGISGGALLFVSMIMASQTFSQWEPNANVNQFTQTLGTLCASVVSVIVMGAFLSKYLPRIPFLNKVILTPPTMGIADESEPRLRPEHTQEGNPMKGLLGSTGETASILRPFGKAVIDHQYVDVVSEGGFIEAGSQVEVVGMKAGTPVVREVKNG